MAMLGYLLLATTLLGIAVSFLRPSFAFVMVFGLYPTKQLMQSYLDFFAANSAVFNYLIFVAVLMGAIGNMLRRDDARQGYSNKLLWLLLATYVYAFFAVMWSPAKENAINLFKGGWPYWLMQVILLPLCLTTLEDFRKSIVWILICGCVICALFFTNPKATYYAGRLTLTINQLADVRGNPLATAQMGGMLAIVGALMLPQRAGWALIFLRLTAVVLGMGMAIAAGSRAQVVFAAAIIVLMYPMARKVKDIKQFFAAVVGVGFMAGMVLVAFSLFVSQNEEQWNRWNPAMWGDVVGSRSNDALRLLELWIEHPLSWPFGLGTNAFSFMSGENLSYAHNLPLEMLAELGVLGFVLYITAAVWTFKYALSLWRSAQDDPAARATYAVFMGLNLYYTLLSFKQGAFASLPEPFFLWAILAKLAEADTKAAIAWREQQEEYAFHYGDESAARSA